MLGPDVLASIEACVLCWLATVDSEGNPNVSPKEIFYAFDSTTLVIANIASPGSVRNIESHASVCVALVDVFSQKGFKLRGMARIVGREAQEFPALGSRLDELAGPSFKVRSAIVVEVTAVEPILSPSYLFVPGTTEGSQREAALRAYGVTAI